MSKRKKSLSHHLDRLIKDARELLDATSDVAGEKVKDARNRLENAVDSTGEIYGRVYENTVAGAKRATQVVKSHPYESIGIAVIVGLLLALLMRSCCDHSKSAEEDEE